ncbi:MAG: UDP-3-O-(3-hydroxymyristoyl)glucosamine N-acyltransferase [Bacteroidales bacterium]|jgi:UDP-3-O-[3-hydroxymyristoyl] glucosamine N-acyltransferase|nr:UDP-3-O-(3-hydroxymyristoyl)glucosamine N-acyltransferase [Bacteroidales bacterium]
MQVTAERIAQHFNGEIIGDPYVKISSVSKIENGKPGNICFLANPKYEHYIYTSKASAIIINKTFVPKEKIAPTLIVVDNAYSAVASLLDLLNSLKKEKRSGRSWRAHVSWSSKIGKGAYIGAFAYVGKKSIIGKGSQIYPQVYIGNNVTVGENVILYQGVKIYDGCKVGDNCILHANCVIGADGFGFAPQPDGTYKKIPQTGIVVLDDNVEVGANTTIDRATMGQTHIGKGTKIDNLVQVAHNVEIGHDNVFAAMTGIAGSTKIGNNCQFGGQSGTVGHIEVGDRVRVGAQTGIIGNTKADSLLMGTPAINYKNYLKSYAHFVHLKEYKEKIDELEAFIKKEESEEK